MLDHIWLFMIILSFACALMTGRMEQLTLAVNDGAGKAVKVLIEMAGSICLWSGLMAIADKSGISDRIAKLLSPALRLIMPELRPGSPALRAVSANVTANILGLGNAATPLGILAMKEMKKTSLLHDSPDNSMVMFVVINSLAAAYPRDRRRPEKRSRQLRPLRHTPDGMDKLRSSTDRRHRNGADTGSGIKNPQPPQKGDALRIR